MTSTFPNSAVELYELQRVQQAKDRGFALFPVAAGDNQPAFVYSIGMAQHEFPELLCFCAPGMESATVGLLTNLCETLIESVSRFGRTDTLRAFCTRTITAKDPEVTYTPQLLQGDTYWYCLNNYLTRAVRYRKQLGLPQVIELRHADVPSIDAVRAQIMLAAS